MDIQSKLVDLLINVVRFRLTTPGAEVERCSPLGCVLRFGSVRTWCCSRAFPSISVYITPLSLLLVLIENDGIQRFQVSHFIRLFNLEACIKS
jgi:hypothetical protein